ncbi:MAG: hypothetical protein DWQ10_12170 [Calditrichaeota bacterium]|nr:MAG: hypothetical protein DWQ10_12170 [Calditrichota bacterium]
MPVLQKAQTGMTAGFDRHSVFFVSQQKNGIPLSLLFCLIGSSQFQKCVVLRWDAGIAKSANRHESRDEMSSQLLIFLFFN